MAGKTHATGSGATLQLYNDGAKFGDEMDVMQWDLVHNGEEVSDGVNGEDADRLDFIHKSWTLNLTMQLATFNKIKAYVKYREDIDAQSIPETALGIKLTPRGAAKTVLYSLTDCSLSGLNLSSGGRTARIQMKLPVRARYMKEITA